MKKGSFNKISNKCYLIRRDIFCKHLLIVMLWVGAFCYGCKKPCARCIWQSGVIRNDTIIAVYYDTVLHKYDTLNKIDTISWLVDFSVLSLCPGNPEYNKVYPDPGGTNFSGWGYTDSSGREYACSYNQ